MGAEAVKTAFVRALWGDRLIPRAVTKTKADLLDCLRRPYQVPFITYSFGIQNTRLLRSVGIEPIQLSKTGIVNFFGAKRRDPQPRPGYRGGQYQWPSPITNWGVSMWRHKLVAIAAALETYDQIVWLDWDCHLLRPLPSNFWDRIAERAELQASLRQYTRLKYGWRPRRVQKCVSGGAFIAMRQGAIGPLLNIQAKHPHEDDETTMARYVDTRLGQWNDPQQYAAAGFEPYCYWIRRQIFEPEVKLFSAR